MKRVVITPRPNLQEMATKMKVSYIMDETVEWSECEWTRYWNEEGKVVLSQKADKQFMEATYQLHNMALETASTESLDPEDAETNRAILDAYGLRTSSDGSFGIRSPGVRPRPRARPQRVVRGAVVGTDSDSDSDDAAGADANADDGILERVPTITPGVATLLHASPRRATL